MFNIKIALHCPHEYIHFFGHFLCFLAIQKIMHITEYAISLIIDTYQNLLSVIARWKMKKNVFVNYQRVHF